MAGENKLPDVELEETLPYECIFDHQRFATRAALIDHLKKCPLNPDNQKADSVREVASVDSDLGDDWMPTLEGARIRKGPPKL
jgi:hypothetical protein